MDWISWSAGIISLLGFIPYIIAILKKETEPHLITWLIWTVVGAILAGSYYYSSHPSFLELLVPIAYVIGPFLITCLAFFYGQLQYTRFDIGCLIAAVCSLILGYLFRNPFLVLLFNILLDFFGAVPTLCKTYLHPWSENLLAWILFLVGNTLNLIALSVWNVEIASYPVYLFLISLIMTGLILSGPFRLKKTI
jgi:hypothetical protein